MLYWIIHHFFRDKNIHAINNSLDKYNSISWLWIHVLQARLYCASPFPQTILTLNINCWHTMPKALNCQFFCFVQNFVTMICTTEFILNIGKEKEWASEDKMSVEINKQILQDFKYLGTSTWRWQAGAQLWKWLMYLEAWERLVFLSTLIYNPSHHNLSHWSLCIILPVSCDKPWQTESILFVDKDDFSWWWSWKSTNFFYFRSLYKIIPELWKF